MPGVQLTSLTSTRAITFVRGLGFHPSTAAPTPPAGDSAILLEDGFYLLLEDGDHILLEA